MAFSGSWKVKGKEDGTWSLLGAEVSHLEMAGAAGGASGISPESLPYPDDRRKV